MKLIQSLLFIIIIIQLSILSFLIYAFYPMAKSTHEYEKKFIKQTDFSIPFVD